MAHHDEVVVDLSNYRDKVGQRVKPGRYRVVVDEAEQETSSKSGNSMIVVWLRVLDGDEAGSVIIDRLVLHPNSLFRVVGFMQALGYPTPKKRLKVNLRQWAGRSLVVQVDDGEPYMGRIKSEVREYLRDTKAKESVADLDDEALDAAIPPGPSGTASPPADLDGLSEFSAPEPVAAPANGNGNGAREEKVTVPPSDETVDLDALDLG